MTGIFLLIGGLILGSFINMLIWRVPQGITLRGRSLCVHCLHTLAWMDLIPVISFLLVRFKCRYCMRKISWRYPFVELLTAGALLCAWSVAPQLFGTLLDGIFNAAVIGVLITLFFIDYTFQIIPDVITLPAIAVLLIIQIARGVSLWPLLLSALVAGGFFAAQYVFSKGRWIGDGDIRIGALMGVILGWPAVVAALIIAYMAGAAIGIMLIGLGRAQLTSKTPFGTYLTAATFVTMLFGPQLIEWYMRLWIRI